MYVIHGKIYVLEISLLTELVFYKHKNIQLELTKASTNSYLMSLETYQESPLQSSLSFEANTWQGDQLSNSLH